MKLPRRKNPEPPKYAIVLNEASSEDLYRWRAIDFVAHLDQARPIASASRGDMIAVVEMDHVSDLIPHLQDIRIYAEDFGWRPLLLLPPAVSVLGDNWIQVYESEMLGATTLWRYFSHLDREESLHVFCEMFSLIDHPDRPKLVRNVIDAVTCGDAQAWPILHREIAENVPDEESFPYEYRALSAASLLLQIVREKQSYTSTGMIDYLAVARTYFCQEKLGRIQSSFDSLIDLRMILKPYIDFREGMIHKIKQRLMRNT